MYQYSNIIENISFLVKQKPVQIIFLMCINAGLILSVSTSINQVMLTLPLWNYHHFCFELYYYHSNMHLLSESSDSESFKNVK